MNPACFIVHNVCVNLGPRFSLGYCAHPIPEAGVLASRRWPGESGRLVSLGRVMQFQVVRQV